MSDSVLLDIPYISQVDRVNPTATYSPSDCSMASLCMVLHKCGKTEVTVDELSKLSGRARGYAYVLPAESIRVAAFYGLKLRHVSNWRYADLIEQLDLERPLIALVKYDLLGVRMLKNFAGGHWVVVTGYDDLNIFYNDPYFPSAEFGKDISISKINWLAAWDGSKLNKNLPRSGLAVM